MNVYGDVVTDECDRPTRRSFAWLCRVQTDFRVISRTVSTLGLAERVGFEPSVSNKINKLGGANGTSNLWNSTRVMNSMF
jgi:hypothetical protein